MHTKDITVKNLNEAVSALGALLSVREFFFKIANDLQVTYSKCSIKIIRCAALI